MVRKTSASPKTDRSNALLRPRGRSHAVRPREFSPARAAMNPRSPVTTNTTAATDRAAAELRCLTL